MVDKFNQCPVEEEMSQLAFLSRAKLVKRWIKVHRSPPPKGIKRGLLERSSAYHLQARLYGRLKPATMKALLAIAEGTPVKVGAIKPTLKPGTQLVREWHGVIHRIEVLDTGVTWRDRHFASLSAVAYAITGAKWSGPRFFGL